MMSERLLGVGAVADRGVGGAGFDGPRLIAKEIAARQLCGREAFAVDATAAGHASRCDRRCGCRWVSGRRSRRGLVVASRCVRLPGGWGGRHRRYRVKSGAMVGGVVIGRVVRTAAVRRLRRPKSSKLATCPRGRGPSWKRNSSCGGLRSRSRVGWWRPSLSIRRSACRTRRSICRCSCSRAAGVTQRTHALSAVWAQRASTTPAIR